MSRVEDELPGAAERAIAGPVHRKGGGVPGAGWLEPRGRGEGTWAFALNRVTGIALVVYLYLHLGVLSLLLFGASVWNRFVDVAGAWPFLGLDVLLIFALLFHALNGIRVALVGSGILVGRQRLLLRAVAVTVAVATAYVALHLFGRL